MILVFASDLEQATHIVRRCPFWAETIVVTTRERFEFECGNAMGVVAYVSETSDPMVDVLAEFRAAYPLKFVVLIIPWRDGPYPSVPLPWADAILSDQELANLPTIIAHVRSTSIMARLANLVRNHRVAEGLIASPLREALIHALLRPRPVASIKVLSSELDVERRLLTKQWNVAMGDAGGSLRDFLAWLVVLHAVGCKTTNRSWAYVAARFRLDEETLARLTRRVSGHSLRKLAVFGQRELLTHFRSHCTRLFGLWPECSCPSITACRNRVLVVDDVEPVRVLIAKLLGRAGFEVRTASCGQTGLWQMISDPHWTQVLLTDLHMPNLSGLDLATLVRARWPAVCIILISAVFARDEKPVRDFLTAHTDVQFLEKPWSYDCVVAMVRAACERRSQPSE